MSILLTIFVVCIIPTPDWIESLRKTLPALFPPKTWAEVRGCCLATIYNDLRRCPEIAVKCRRATRVIRDRALDFMAGFKPWVPERDRAVEDDRPYARSRPRPGPVNCIADAAKPTPPAAAAVAKPRRDRQKRASAPPVPRRVACEAMAPPERCAPAEPQSRPRGEPCKAIIRIRANERFEE